MKLLFVPGSGGGREEWLFQTEYFPNSESVPLPSHPEGKPCSSIEEYLADRIEGAIQVVIPGGSHFVYMEKPNEVNQAIEEFLAGLR